MKQCTCTTTQHHNHPGKTCGQPATTDYAYCKDCHDKLAKEHADTQPDLLSYSAQIEVHSGHQLGILTGGQAKDRD
jgi:hypothetical protein